MTTGAAGPFS